MRSMARDDAWTAKRMFVFLGRCFAGTDLVRGCGVGQRAASEQAILRIRGANRRQLLRMHALRTPPSPASARCSVSPWA